MICGRQEQQERQNVHVRVRTHACEQHRGRAECTMTEHPTVGSQNLHEEVLIFAQLMSTLNNLSSTHSEDILVSRTGFQKEK